MQFEGINPKGGPADQQLQKLRLDIYSLDLEQMAKEALPVEYISELTEAGLTSAKPFDPYTCAIPPALIGSPLENILDAAALLRFDQRVRWCRAGLYEKGWPCHDQPVSVDSVGKIHWLNSDNPNHDQTLFDAILNSSDLRHSVEWYCAKCLTHASRALALVDELHDQNGRDFKTTLPGLLREWMLFSETWSEASQVTRHGWDAIRGKGTKKSAGSGGERNSQENHEPKRRAVIVEMGRILAERKGLTPSAAAKIAFERGIGTSPGANAIIWSRYGPKN